MRRLGRGQGARSVSPAGPPSFNFPLSASAPSRGPARRHFVASPFLPFGPLLAPSSRQPGYRSSLHFSAPLRPPGTWKNHPKTWSVPRRPAPGAPGLPVGTRAPAAGGPFPGPSPESLGGCRVSAGAASPRRVHAHPGLGDPRAGSQLPSLREPRGRGRWRRRRRRVPARSPGESLGRSAPPWPRAPRAGSGAGAGCGRAPSSRLPPPARRRGRAPSEAPSTLPRAVAGAGGGAAGFPGLRARPGGGAGGAGRPG